MEYVLPVEKHDQIVEAAYCKRGYTAEEAVHGARLCRMASWHGIKTHNAIKALHLDDLFGSQNTLNPGCVPGATIIKKPSRFEAAQKWNAQRKLGQAVAFEAMDTAMSLADKHGVGIVSVDQTFHYLWGGGYVMDAARKGYIAYTNCTSSLAEVVPFGGNSPTLGTNPHSWGFPTTEAVGFPIVIDWASSTVAMGKVTQLARDGGELPPHAAIDQDGNPTTDPNRVAALLPFGGHKGYGLSLIDELFAAFIGGSLPTLRSRPQQAGPGEKTTCNFFFQAIHADALNCGAFACGRNQAQNVQSVIDDILGHGNRDTGRCILPGQIEHEAAVRSEQAGGLLFSETEIEQLVTIGQGAGIPLDGNELRRV